MRSARTLTRVAAAAATLALGLAACGGGAGAGRTRPGVELRMTIWTSNEAHLKLFDEIADEYKARPPRGHRRSPSTRCPFETTPPR